MSNAMLDYAFKVSSITPTPAASTGFLKKLCVVVKPLNGGVTTGVVTSCTTQAQIAALTANLEAQQALNAGLSSVFILPMDDLNLASALVGKDTQFYTLAISSDFDDENEDAYATGSITITNYSNLTDAGADEITVGGVTFVAQAGAVTPGQATFQAATSNEATATSLAAQINAHASLNKVTALAAGAVVGLTYDDPGQAGNEIALAYSDEGTATVGATVSGAFMTGGTHALDVGTFRGVVGLYSQDDETAAEYAAAENQVGFFAGSTNKAKNMIYAFGKMLSNALNWRNQQFISMPSSQGDGITELGDAEALFEDRVSFVLTDADYGNRLAMFAVGGKAIVAPYIVRNLQIDLQSKALQWISANQPAYTLVNAALLESELEKVVASYINVKQWITAGTVSVTLDQDNFVASGAINIAEPKALWRVVAEMQQTL